MAAFGDCLQPYSYLVLIVRIDVISTTVVIIIVQSPCFHALHPLGFFINGMLSSINSRLSSIVSAPVGGHRNLFI